MNWNTEKKSDGIEYEGIWDNQMKGTSVRREEIESIQQKQKIKIADIESVLIMEQKCKINH